MDYNSVRGRLAPSPSGRMHLGNAFSALLAWLSVRSRGGTLILRMEDLDEARCRRDYGETLMDDLRWLGLNWDEGPVWQSERRAVYAAALKKLDEQGLIYPCYCNRAERLAASAPHRGGGETVHHCRCGEYDAQARARLEGEGRKPAWRVRPPDETVSFQDRHMGPHAQNLQTDCGDFIVRRSDGVYAYQLAVVADDGAMGVTEAVRGCDLLDSTPRQIWLHRRLGYAPPAYAHVPLLVAPDGRRLSKRDGDLDFAALRARYTPEQVVGRLAFWAGLLEREEPCAARDLITVFDWGRVRRGDIVVAP